MLQMSVNSSSRHGVRGLRSLHVHCRVEDREARLKLWALWQEPHAKRLEGIRDRSTVGSHWR